MKLINQLLVLVLHTESFQISNFNIYDSYEIEHDKAAIAAYL